MIIEKPAAWQVLVRGRWCNLPEDWDSTENQAAYTYRPLFAVAQGWQDISTAPHDDQPIIYQDADGAVSTCSWQFDDCGASWWDIAGDQLAHPVRWMPLPPVHIADQRGDGE